MSRPQDTKSEPATDSTVFKSIRPLLFMVLLVGSLFTVMHFKGSAPKKKKPKQQIKLAAPDPAKKKKKSPVKVPLPTALLALVKDGTLIDDQDEPAHDKLREHVASLSLEEIEKRAKPVTGLVKALPSMRGAFVEIRGKLLNIVSKSIIGRPSGLQLVEVGQLKAASGKIIHFEMVTANVHGLLKGEQVIVRAACYKLATVLDKKHKARLLPFVIGKQIQLDYSAYIPRISDGAQLEDYYYFALMRKVRFDRPDQIKADTAPTPTRAELSKFPVRQKLRGKYLTVTGKLLEVRKHEFLKSNRAFMTVIWRGKLQTASGIWCFDTLEKPAYLPFLERNTVRLTGAFAKLWSWTDDKGKPQKSPYLISPGLRLAEDRPAFQLMPELLEQIKDRTQTRDITYYYLLHQLVNLTDEQIADKVKRDFSVGDIVELAQRDKMRGALVEISGQLLKVEEFPLEFQRRLNPSGVTTIYRCYLVDGRQTIFTIDVLEKPTLKLRSEVKAQGAFWKVYQYPTRRRGQSEKSPYLIARRLVKRIPPTSPAHDQFLVLIVGLIAVLIVFLAAVGRSEWRKANQFREELRKRRSAKGLGLGTPPSPPADPPTEAPEP